MTDVLHEVISEVVRGDDQTAEVDEGSNRHHGEWGPGDVDDLQGLQWQVAHLSHLIKNVFS